MWASSALLDPGYDGATYFVHCIEYIMNDTGDLEPLAMAAGGRAIATFVNSIYSSDYDNLTCQDLSTAALPHGLHEGNHL